MYRTFCVTVGVLAAITTLHPSAQQPAAGATVPKTAMNATGATKGGPRLLPGTRSSVFSTIQGNALDSTNGVLPNTVVRLRDARVGGIVDRQITDKSGLFAFRTVDPGSYVVEVVGNDQTILAASQMLNVNAGETMSAVVKLPFRIPPFAGVLGHSVPQAASVASAAATSGVLSSIVAGEPTSP